MSNDELEYIYQKGKGWIPKYLNHKTQYYYLMVWLPSFRDDLEVGGWGGWVRNCDQIYTFDELMREIADFHNENETKVREFGWKCAGMTTQNYGAKYTNSNRGRRDLILYQDNNHFMVE